MIQIPVGSQVDRDFFLTSDALELLKKKGFEEKAKINKNNYLQSAGIL